MNSDLIQKQKTLPRKQKAQKIFIVGIFVLVFIGIEVSLFVGDLPRQKFCESIGGVYHGEFPLHVIYRVSDGTGCVVNTDIWKQSSDQIQEWEDSTNHSMTVYSGPSGHYCQVFPHLKNSSICNKPL